MMFVKMQSCSWMSFSKMQFCGYPSIQWNFVGCLSLNTKKIEKKNYSSFLKGGLLEKMSDVGDGID